MKTIKTLSALALGAMTLALGACDDIASEDRLIPVERPEVKRVVLVQEFTGQDCVNCPNGAATMHALQEQYPGSVIAVNLHPENTPYTVPLLGLDLTCKEATVYYQTYRPNGFPAAMVNNSTLLYNIDQWSTAVTSALSTPAPADIDIRTSYDPATRKLTADYDIKFNTVFSGDLNVMVWVMENNIIGAQLSSSQGLIIDYEHNHVLRASLNGDWGESLGTTDFMPEDVVSGSSSINLKDNWVADNCQVVVFIYHSSSKAVEQAAVADVTTAQEND